MRKIVAIALVFFSLSIKAVAAERPERPERPERNDELGLTADLTVASKYMTDGFKIGGDNPVLQPSIDLKIGDTGFSGMFWSVLQLDRAQTNREFDELDFMALYAHTFWDDSRAAVAFHGYLDYWFYPKNQTYTDSVGKSVELPQRRGNKLHAGISFPRILPLAGSYLVPTYNAYYWLYWAQNRRDQFQGGAHHELMLSYYHDVPPLLLKTKEMWAGASASINYNDGVFDVHPGWSHSVAQLGLGAYALGGALSLNLNHQWSFISSVDPTDETWETFSFTKGF
jgi:hypothetical protein